ncbi:MAG: hypothetical protein JXJ04_18525 [Spirochaetales bacterium]|nr:hypothetical protein [Spirochaetales bacterium]
MNYKENKNQQKKYSLKIMFLLLITLILFACTPKKEEHTPRDSDKEDHTRQDSGNEEHISRDSGEPELNRVVNIIHSSYILYDKDIYMYHPAKVFDAKPETGWLENGEGFGMDEFIGIEFEQKITVDEISFMPGYFVKKWYKNNNRVKKIQVITENDELVFDFEDIMTEQRKTLPHPISFTSIRFFIKDVYKSEADDDTAISEICFYFQGSKIEFDMGDAKGYLAKKSIKPVNISLLSTYIFPKAMQSESYHNEIRYMCIEDNAIYAATRNNIFVSKDYGKNWEMLDTPFTYINNFDTEDSLLCAGTTPDGLFISTDSGKSWRKIDDFWYNNCSILNVYIKDSIIYVQPEINQLVSGDCHGGLFISKYKGYNTWTYFADKYEDEDVDDTINCLYAEKSASYVSSRKKGFMISTNEGQTWKNYTKTAYLENETIQDIYAKEEVICVATRNGLSMSTDNGLSWKKYKKTDGIGHDIVNTVYIEKSFIYAGTIAGLSLSGDNGKTWTTLTTKDGLSGDDVSFVMARGSTVYVQTTSGISISYDNGISWKTITQQDGLGQGKIGVFSIKDSVLCALTWEGISISVDNGKTWNTCLVQMKDLDVTGYEVNSIYAQGPEVYAGTSKGLYLSSDYGASLRKITSNGELAESDITCVTGVESNIYAGTKDEGFFISTNNGKSWEARSDKLSSNEIYSLYVNTSGIYAGTVDGLAFSKDKGLTWNTYEIDSISYGTILSVYAEGPVIYTGIRGDQRTGYFGEGFTVSTDGGESWKSYTTEHGLGGNILSSIYKDKSVIYAGALNPSKKQMDFSLIEGGLSVSTDGGRMWKTYTSQNGLADNYVTSVYANDTMIIAGTYKGLSVSPDLGKTWKTYTNEHGLPSNRVHCFYIDEPRLYVGTNGGISVFSLE